MSREIGLTKGLKAIVDDEDYPRLAQHKWFAKKDKGTSYACRGLRGPRGVRLVYMHREIAGPGHEQEIDHANSDGLDNRRANLRLAGNMENQANARVYRNNTSGFKGVVREKRRCRNQWRAQIMVRGKNLHAGYFDDPKSAARAYDEAAARHFGEFARTNASMGLL